MSALTSWDKVRNAFAAAGYSCRGAHGARNYAGTPFSTARSDDCAPVSSGTVACNSNAVATTLLCGLWEQTMCAPSPVKTEFRQDMP